jgi:exonuclease-1
MGISELLKVLKPILSEAHISEFKDKTAAIDIMAWIYRGVYASAVDLGKGIDSDIYLNFPVKMLAMLKAHGVRCIAVFDGKVPKAKESVCESRREYKEKSLETANQLLEEGREDESNAHFRRALKIKTKMLNTIIEVLKRLKVEVVVAPYEADAQIAYLCKTGLADFAISEDSDLVPFGVQKVLYKLTSDGFGEYLDLEDLASRDLSKFPCCEVISKLNHLQLVEVCVMSGCDYIPSIKGMGIKTVLKLFQSLENIERVVHGIMLIKKYNIPADYLENAKKVVGMFFLQTVFDPKDGKLKSLTDLEACGNDVERKINETLKRKSYGDGNFGEPFEGHLAYCKGELDLKTMTGEKRLESEEVIKKYVTRHYVHFNEFKVGVKPNNIQKVNINKPMLLIKPTVNNIVPTNNIVTEDSNPGCIIIPDEDSNKLHDLQFEEYNKKDDVEDFDNLVKENDLEMQKYIQDSLKKKPERKPNFIAPCLNFLQEIDKVIKPTTPIKPPIDLTDTKPKSLFDLIDKEKEVVSISPSKAMFSPSVNKTQSTSGTSKPISEYLVKSPFSMQTTFNTTPRKYSEMNPKALDFGTNTIAHKKFK